MLQTSIENGFILKRKEEDILQKSMNDTDYSDDQALLVNTSAQVKFQLYSLDQVVRRMGVFVNVNKTEYMCLKPKGAIYTKPLKLVNQFKYLSSNISSTEAAYD